MRYANGRPLFSKSVVLPFAFACVSIACNGSQYVGGVRSPSSALENPSAPQATVDRLTECANHGSRQFTDTNYAVIFDIEATESGEVREATIKDSILGDSDMESCMVRALESMELPQELFSMRSGASISSGVLPSQSRAQMGNVLVLGGSINLIPILIVAGGVTIIVAITIHAMSGTQTATQDISDEDRERERCKKAKEECIVYCSDTTLPTADFGWKFQKCKNECLEKQGCPRDS